MAQAKLQAASRKIQAASLARQEKPATSKKRRAGRVLLIAGALAAVAQLVRSKLTSTTPPAGQPWNQPPRQPTAQSAQPPQQEPAQVSDSS
jgi:cytochrome c-type biogenesis protein CcmH/NrfG